MTIDDHWRFDQLYLSYVATLRNIVGLQDKSFESWCHFEESNSRGLIDLHTTKLSFALAWELLQDAQRQTCTHTVAGSKNSNIWIHMAHDKLGGCGRNHFWNARTALNLGVWTPNKPKAPVCRFWFWMQAGFWWTETLSGHLERKAHVWCHRTTMQLDFAVGLLCVGPLKMCEVFLLHDRPLDSTTRALPDTAQSKSSQTRSLKRVRLQVQFRSP